MTDQMQFHQSTQAPDPVSVEQPATRHSAGPLVFVLVIGLAAGLIVGWLFGRSRTDDSTDGPVAMVETVDQWIAAVRNEDAAAIAQLYGEDAVWYDEATGDSFEGPSGVQRAWSLFGYVEEVVEVKAVAVGDDKAVVSWTLDGIPDWYLTGLSVLEFDGDVIVAETLYYDCAQSPVASRCANVG